MYRAFANSKFPGRIAHGSSIFDDIQGKTHRPVLWQTFQSAPSPLAGFLDTILCGLMGENAGGRVRFGIGLSGLYLRKPPIYGILMKTQALQGGVSVESSGIALFLCRCPARKRYHNCEPAPCLPAGCE